MDFSEPDHIRQLRATLQRFIDKEMPRSAAAAWDRDNHFPREVFQRLGQLGVMGLTVPEEHGGAGRNIVATMVVIEELSRRSLAVSVPYIMSACYAGMNLVECATPEQQQRLLPRVADGSLMFAYGWTEPDVGADLASVKTRAERRGDQVVVNGAKRFCSGASICDYIYALVRTGPESARHKNLSLVLIPPDTPGVTITPIESMGMKGAATTDVLFDDVTIPFTDVMGGEAGWNNGWSMLMGAGLDVEKLEVAAIGVGVARAALQDAWSYVYERRQFGQPIASHQSIQHKLAEMKTQLHAATLVLYQAAWLADNHRPCSVETSMAKLFATEAARAIALEAQTILGAYGYVKDFDTERHVRDALLLPIIGGSSAIQRGNIFRWSKTTI
ncbi:acyl-CoA dehydrogenase family protein [Variovorax boronicumulans]|uniref:acyl-CoA dehydrogenase family protein n=1 Tax=Variovorax boronicumulans TaxID=436515 RepID=UPI001C566E00